MIRWQSIRVVVPALTLLFICFTLAIALLSGQSLAYRRIVEDGIKQVSDRLNFIQGVAEQLIALGAVERLNHLISNFAAEPDLLALLVTDHKGEILASIRYVDTGKHYTETSYIITSEKVVKATNSNSSVLDEDHKRHIITGYAPVCTKGEGLGLRSTQCGFLYYRLDLAYQYRLARANFYRVLAVSLVGSGLGAMLLLAALSRLITRRTALMAEISENFSRGERERRIAITGRDELAWLGQSLNRLFDSVEDNETALQEKEERWRSLVETVVDAVITINDKGIIESFNQSAENMFGYNAKEVIGKNVSLLMPEPHKSLHNGYMKNYIDTGHKKVIGIGREVEAIKKNGVIFPVELAVSEMTIHGERLFTGLIRDITEKRKLRDDIINTNRDLFEANLKLEELARTDGLTGLYNRRHFDTVLEEEMHRASRMATPVSLIMCDIDHFKHYNDILGHQAGDACLISIAGIIKQHFLRGSDLPARYGGEEFVIIMPGFNESQCYKHAELLRQSVRAASIAHPGSDTDKYVTISIGIASFQPNDSTVIPPTPALLIETADHALYEAKRAGRNQVKLGGVI